MNLKEMIKNELTGWKKLEVFWLFTACTIIACLSIYWNDSLMGIISAITGVACVVCTGKGKLSAYTTSSDKFFADLLIVYYMLLFHLMLSFMAKLC